MEEKKYEIVGTVTIGTDEYRDLVRENCELQKDISSANREKWDIQSKLRELEEKYKKTSEELDKFKKFAESSEEQKAKYKLYLIEVMESNKNE